MTDELGAIEWFDQRENRHGRRGRKDPSLGIQKKGTATLNKAAVEALDSPPAIAVGYIPSRRIIVMKGVEDSASEATPYRRVGESSTVLFSLVAFLNKHGIVHEQRHQYTGQLQDDLLFFQLDQEV